MLSVLIIEDDVLIQRVLERALRSRFPGCFIQTVDGITQGYNHLTGQTHFDVVLCDGNLPDGYGAELVDTFIRAHEGPAFIGMSGNPEQIDALGAAGCSGLLQKPFTLEHFIAAICVVCFPEQEDSCDGATDSVPNAAHAAGDRANRRRFNATYRFDYERFGVGNTMDRNKVEKTASPDSDAPGTHPGIHPAD